MPRPISVLLFALLAIVAIPVAAAVGITSSIFGLKRKSSALEVASYLRDFVEGNGSDYDWDDFTSVPIADPPLEDIRQRAAEIELPVTEEGSAVIRELLAEALGLARAQPASEGKPSLSS